MGLSTLQPPTKINLKGIVIFLLSWSFFVLIPIAGLLLWSFLTMENFRPVWDLSLQAYREVFASGRWEVTARTLGIASLVTLLEIVLALPFALWLSKGTKNMGLKITVLAALTIPFFLSLSARTIVWRALLGLHGPVNYALMASGVIDGPLDWLLFSQFSVILGLIGPYFPTMVFPLYLSINLIDDEMLAASTDLGATPGFTFWHVILPLAFPGLGAGIIFTFVPMIGDSVVPTLLGGGHVILLSASVESLLRILNYSVAAALSVVMLSIMVGVILVVSLVSTKIITSKSSALPEVTP